MMKDISRLNIAVTQIEIGRIHRWQYDSSGPDYRGGGCPYVISPPKRMTIRMLERARYLGNWHTCSVAFC